MFEVLKLKVFSLFPIGEGSSDLFVTQNQTYVGIKP